MLIHIKRKFLNIPSGKKESIYFIPNINNDINKLFIDDLNGPNINLEFFEEMIELGFLIDEETEFKKTLLSLGITSRYMSKINPEEYIEI